MDGKFIKTFIQSIIFLSLGGTSLVFAHEQPTNVCELALLPVTLKPVSMSSQRDTEHLFSLQREVGPYWIQLKQEWDSIFSSKKAKAALSGRYVPRNQWSLEQRAQARQQLDDFNQRIVKLKRQRARVMARVQQLSDQLERRNLKIYSPEGGNVVGQLLSSPPDQWSNIGPISLFVLSTVDYPAEEIERLQLQTIFQGSDINYQIELVEQERDQLQDQLSREIDGSPLEGAELDEVRIHLVASFKDLIYQMMRDPAVSINAKAYFLSAFFPMQVGLFKAPSRGQAQAPQFPFLKILRNSLVEQSGGVGASRKSIIDFLNGLSSQLSLACLKEVSELLNNRGELNKGQLQAIMWLLSVLPNSHQI